MNLKYTIDLFLFVLAHITGFEDVDLSAQSSSDVKDNGDLEQLKQRLPWNQLPTSSEVSVAESGQLQQVFHTTF